MKLDKKVTSLVLIAGLSLGALSSCGEKKEDKNPGSGSASTELNSVTEKSSPETQVDSGDSQDETSEVETLSNALEAESSSSDEQAPQEAKTLEDSLYDLKVSLEALNTLKDLAPEFVSEHEEEFANLSAQLTDRIEITENAIEAQGK